MDRLRYIFAAGIAILAVFLVFAWHMDWFQRHFQASRFWSTQLDLVEYQIAHTEMLLSYSRDSRTNDQNRVVVTYLRCLSDLKSKREAVRVEASPYLSNENQPRDWRQLNLEPRANEYMLDEIEKTRRQIIGHEEWLAETLKSWDRGTWTNAQIDKKVSQFCEMVLERQARLHELAAANYFLAERTR